jgi:hypothetical protein
MAKRGRPKGETEEGSLKVDRPIATQAKAIAQKRGISVRAYVSSLLRGPVARDYLKTMKELEKEQEVAAAEAAKQRAAEEKEAAAEHPPKRKEKH